MATLQQRLDAIRAGFQKQAPPEVNGLMHRATREPGLGVGDPLPPFRLPDQNGNVVESAALQAL
jgi:hypothetical protein